MHSCLGRWKSANNTHPNCVNNDVDKTIERVNEGAILHMVIKEGLCGGNT